MAACSWCVSLRSTPFRELAVRPAPPRRATAGPAGGGLPDSQGLGVGATGPVSCPSSPACRGVAWRGEAQSSVHMLLGGQSVMTATRRELGLAPIGSHWLRSQPMSWRACRCSLGPAARSKAWRGAALKVHQFKVLYTQPLMMIDGRRGRVSPRVCLTSTATTLASYRRREDGTIIRF